MVRRRSKYRKSKVARAADYNARSNQPEGKGTNRSLGSNKRLRYLAGKRQ